MNKSALKASLVFCHPGAAKRSRRTLSGVSDWVGIFGFAALHSECHYPLNRATVLFIVKSITLALP